MHLLRQIRHRPRQRNPPQNLFAVLPRNQPRKLDDSRLSLLPHQRLPQPVHRTDGYVDRVDALFGQDGFFDDAVVHFVFGGEGVGEGVEDDAVGFHESDPSVFPIEDYVVACFVVVRVRVFYIGRGELGIFGLGLVWEMVPFGLQSTYKSR